MLKFIQSFIFFHFSSYGIPFKGFLFHFDKVWISSEETKLNKTFLSYKFTFCILLFVLGLLNYTHCPLDLNIIWNKLDLFTMFACNYGDSLITFGNISRSNMAVYHLLVHAWFNCLQGRVIKYAKLIYLWKGFITPITPPLVYCSEHNITVEVSLLKNIQTSAVVMGIVQI